MEHFYLALALAVIVVMIWGDKWSIVKDLSVIHMIQQIGSEDRKETKETRPEV